MKKSIYLSLISFLLAACSGESPVLPEPGVDTPEIQEGTEYLSVWLAMPSSASRATDYIDGTPAENNINWVRFYFFDASGNAAPVRELGSSGNYESYLDWTPTDDDQSYGNVAGQTVEKIATATLGINVPAQGQLPALVLAVVNPSQEIIAMSPGNTLEQMRQVVSDYYTGLTSNNFIITNSVYSDNQVLVDATPINSSNYGLTADEADENPLVIYVERALARLDLSINIENGVSLPGNSGYMYPTSEEPFVVGGQNQDIYVQFLGWNVTATPSASRLVKKISPTWNDNIFGNLTIWNSDNYHRSFWAVNPQSDDFYYQYGNFNGAENTASGNFRPANANAVPAPNATTSTYMQENAAVYTTTDEASGPSVPSKVIIAAQLLNANGQPLTLAFWSNRYYTPTGILNAVANSLNLYQAVQSGSSTTFTQITPDYLQLVSATQLYGPNLPENVAGYYVYVQLTEEAESITWYNGNTLTSPTFTTAQANNYIIERINYMMYWQSGMTYYYFDIKHLGAEGNPGYLGVVRNHVYMSNITSVSGLGTPVFNPNEIIYPETPGYDDAVISAQVEILQWRIVSQDYELVWP